MINNKTINAEELGYVSPRAKVITLMMSHSLLQDQSDNLEGMDPEENPEWGNWE